jgi:probable HAF family extracellular repeat protein
MKWAFCGWASLSLLWLGIAEQAKAGFVFTTLDPPGSTSTAVNGINADGRVVGNYYDAGGTQHGFLLSGGLYTTLDVPGASTGAGGTSQNGTSANGINSAGNIVGLFYDEGGTRHGYRLSGGSFTTLDPPGSDRTQALSINDSDQIVGSYRASDAVHGFLLSGGVYTTLDVPGSSLTVAFGTNNAGEIVGDYQDSGGTFHGFLLSGGVYTTLDVPGSPFTIAEGIDAAGQIAGWYADAFSPDEGPVGLHGFLLSGGVYTTLDVPGSTSTQVFAINDAGQVVGRYADASGEFHGFLATPVPEPTSFVLFGLGMLGLIGCTWRQRKRT